MKNIILFVSLVFPGFYISYDFDASAEGEIEALGYYPVSLENTYDSGALTIGYESLDLKNNIGQEGLIAYGLSYDIIGADYTGADDGDGFLNIEYKEPIYGCNVFGADNYDVSVTLNNPDMCIWWMQCGFQPYLFPDCNDICYNVSSGTPLQDRIGDGSCDDGASQENGYPAYNLNCQRWNFDGGDCGVFESNPYHPLNELPNAVDSHTHIENYENNTYAHDCDWVDCQDTKHQSDQDVNLLHNSILCYEQKCFDTVKSTSLTKLEESTKKDNSVLVISSRCQQFVGSTLKVLHSITGVPIIYNTKRNKNSRT